MKWELVFHFQAVEFHYSQRGVNGRKLAVALGTLAAHPFVPPDEILQRPNERPYFLRCWNNFVVVFWIDFFVKEVRVVEIRKRWP